MVNRNWEDPYDVAELAKEDGPEGLMRLADYFETTGQPIPAPVKTALLTSRGPGVFPIQGIFPSKRSVVRSPVEGVPEALRPSVPFLEGAVETNRRALAFNPTDSENEENAKLFGITPEEMRKSFTQARANTFQLTEPEVQESAKTFDISLEEMRKSLAAARGGLGKGVSPASQAARTAASVQEPKGPRSVAKASPSSSSTFAFAPPSYTLEDAPPQVQDYPRPAVVPSYTLEDAPVPVASVPAKTSDIAAAIPTASSVGTKAIPPTTSTSSAPPAGTSSTVKPPPVDAGSGGDDALDRLSIGQALTRALEGSGSIIAGRDLRSGAADTLGERMKQIEALRAKREERAMELAREDEQSSALVQQYKSLAAQGLVPELPALDRLPPKQAASLIKTYGSLPGLVQKTEKTRAEIPLVEARTGTEEEKAEQKDKQLKETERHNRAMEAAAALAAQRAARGAAEDRGVRPEALTNRLKDLNAQTKPFQEIVSSLQEADAALSALGTGQISRGAKIASKIPLVGESLVSTPELRAMQGQEGLKQSYQKLKTGLAAVGQELASFERQFGTDWQADPRKAPMAIETLKQITQDALRRTQAPFGAGTGNPAIDQMEVLSLLKNTNGLTADNPIFRPNPKLAAAAGLTPPPPPAPAPVTRRPAKPTAIPEGKAVLWSLAEGKWKAVPAENADAAVASGKYER